MERTQVVAQRGTPWALAAFVALLIAKLGFGVQIAWIWVLAPFWVPIALILALFAAFAIGYGLILGIVVMFTAIGGVLSRREQKRRYGF